MATVAQRNRARDGRGRYRRTIDNVDRDVQAAMLHAQGKSYDEIAAELGFGDKGRAYHAVERALIERGRSDRLELAREARLAELDALRAKLWEVILNPPPVVSRTGKIVADDDGVPVPDVQAMAAAASALIRASERTARLRGLDAPRRSHTTVEGLLASLSPGDMTAFIEARITQLRTELGNDGFQQATVAERRQHLMAELAKLDTEEAQLAAIPAAVEPAA